MFYRTYINHKTTCWVLYADTYPNHRNPIKKRTMYRSCHIMCKRSGLPYLFTETQYYPPYRDYKS